VTHLSTKTRHVLRVAFGLVLLSALVLLGDFQRVAAILHAVNLVWVGVSAILTILATLTGALSLHLLFNTERKLPFRVFLPVFWTSWAIGLVIPGQVGDVASLAAMLKRHNINLAASVGRSVIDKLISLLVMVLFGAWSIHRQLSVPTLLYISAILFVVFGVSYLMRACLPAALYRQRIVAFLIGAGREARAVGARFPIRVAVNVILTAVKICLTGATYWCMFRAFDLDVPLWRVIPMVAISSLVAYIPISFNGIGTAEATGIVIFGMLGVHRETVLGGYLILRALGFAIAWIPAAVWMLIRRIS
jgi:uncharacterized membrane protein YbhN (UPF0104 family)